MGSGCCAPYAVQTMEWHISGRYDKVHDDVKAVNLFCL